MEDGFDVWIRCGGKTTILCKLALDEVVTAIPTRTCNTETIESSKVNYTIYDMRLFVYKEKLWNPHNSNNASKVRRNLKN